MEQNMRKMKITLDTLNQELREKDIFRIEEVQYAVLELNGKFRDEKTGILARDAQGFADYSHQTVVSDRVDHGREDHPREFESKRL